MSDDIFDSDYVRNGDPRSPDMVQSYASEMHSKKKSTRNKVATKAVVVAAISEILRDRLFSANAATMTIHGSKTAATSSQIICTLFNGMSHFTSECGRKKTVEK